MTSLKEAISLDLIKTFAVFAEVGSVDLAAERLGLTQAAVSFQLKRLEKEMGLALFQSLGRRKVLTQIGLDLFRQLAPPLKNLESALKEVSAKTRASQSPSLRLLCDPLLVLALNSVIEITQSFTVESLHQQNDLSPEATAPDLVFVTELPQRRNKILSKKLCDFELVVVANNVEADLKKAPIYHASVYELLKHRVSNDTKIIEPKLVTSDWLQLLSEIKKSNSWSIMPDFAATEMNLKKMEPTWWTPQKLNIYLYTSVQLGSEPFKKVRLAR